LIALLNAAFIYLEALDLSQPLITTLFGIAALYLLLGSGNKTWFFYGFFTGLFWFWWIGLSFFHYSMPWAIPLVLLAVAGIYGVLFWLIAKTAYTIQSRLPSALNPLPSLAIQSIGLLVMSYIHPFGFDWFKPELVFTNSYLGIQKWQFALILSALVLTHWKKRFVYLLSILLAYQPTSDAPQKTPGNIQLVTTYTTVEEKWDKTLHAAQFEKLFASIDRAIDGNKTLVILPESVFPVFIGHTEMLMKALRQRAQKISIVTGGLYWDGETPRNSTYIFTNDKITVANKVILVPFGESNPLPDFLSKWVNDIFYDGAVDYKASKEVIDYTIDGTTYRNAICFEATSEKLYEGEPENMIVLSNNGWFVPSIEPTLQRVLLQYYSKKYGTTIYHAVNMAPSYMIRKGRMREI
jgi:apolipoprotein N-acyltransferase